MENADLQGLLRRIPAVHKLLSFTTALQQSYSFDVISDAASKMLDELRQQIRNGILGEVPTIEDLIERLESRLRAMYHMHYRPVINATGVILHTNLGRAPLSDAAVEAIVQTAKGYSNLEYRLEEGTRGSRYDHVEALLCRLTGAEAACVVNNNAAAVLLILRELAKGREVIISRGQIVEIGGSFRVFEVMRESGTQIVEVGTTNKTHIFDYKNAITDQTGLLLRVHTSNYRMIGFVHQPSLQELVDLSRQTGIPLYEDLGSGSLLDVGQFGLQSEPTVLESVKAGVDIVSFSGDKLLGGSQAGIIVGKRSFIERIKKNQLMRALRVDKLTLAALEATLRQYLDPERALETIPTLWMMNRKLPELYEQAERLANGLQTIFQGAAVCSIMEIPSQIGGGSLPGEELPSYGVKCMSDELSLVALEQELRRLDLPIVARFSKDGLVFDVRTIYPEQIESCVKGCEKAYAKLQSRSKNE
jgi:L-seryl-tRNA(Ser) seleniumtransferase